MRGQRSGVWDCFLGNISGAIEDGRGAQGKKLWGDVH